MKSAVPAKKNVDTPPTSSRKGVSSRELILAHALGVADASGLDALTIGSLADAVGKSKSGVFAHFGSREDLQLAVLELATRRFRDRVILPALTLKRGLARLRAILLNSLHFHHNITGGCLILQAAHEFDDRPGPVLEAVTQYLQGLQRELQRCVHHALEADELRENIDPELLAFECVGVFLASHHALKALRDPNAAAMAERAISRLLQNAARDGRN